LRKDDLFMKRYLIMAACVALIPTLAACAQTPLPVAVATDTPAPAVASPTVSSPPTPTSSPATEQATETATEAAAFPTPNPNPECVVAPIPEDPNIPPAGADEWSEGAADAPIVLMDYSDFQ
jgi:hypothetical protein